MSALDHLHHPRLLLALAALSALAIPVPLVAAEILPPASQLRPDRPRLLLRPSKTPHAISLEELRGPPRDREFEALLGQLRGNRHAAAQAMVWLLTGE
ncbi:MAG: hypothetical protein JXA90_00345, partial [Planctomycetes bacterium]|nr:hypothetical protein [Planctomycetota bacterium]